MNLTKWTTELPTKPVHKYSIFSLSRAKVDMLERVVSDQKKDIDYWKKLYTNCNSTLQEVLSDSYCDGDCGECRYFDWCDNAQD